jgi:hypothetical protein
VALFPVLRAPALAIVLICAAMTSTAADPGTATIDDVLPSNCTLIDDAIASCDYRTVSDRAVPFTVPVGVDALNVTARGATGGAGAAGGAGGRAGLVTATVDVVPGAVLDIRIGGRGGPGGIGVPGVGAPGGYGGVGGGAAGGGALPAAGLGGFGGGGGGGATYLLPAGQDPTAESTVPLLVAGGGGGGGANSASFGALHGGNAGGHFNNPDGANGRSGHVDGRTADGGGGGKDMFGGLGSAATATSLAAASGTKGVGGAGGRSIGGGGGGGGGGGYYGGGGGGGSGAMAPVGLGGGGGGSSFADPVHTRAVRFKLGPDHVTADGMLNISYTLPPDPEPATTGSPGVTRAPAAGGGWPQGILPGPIRERVTTDAGRKAAATATARKDAKS